MKFIIYMQCAFEALIKKSPEFTENVWENLNTSTFFASKSNKTSLHEMIAEINRSLMQSKFIVDWKLLFSLM